MKTLGKEKNFLAIDKDFSDFETSKIVIVPIPFESTTSYGKGTKNGPNSILQASAYVEFFDDETKKELCFEKGIATITPIEIEPNDTTQIIENIHSLTKEILGKDKFIVFLGGEHTISFPIIKAYYEFYNDISILHFDAHSDLRNSYNGSSFSHACFMARVLEFFPKPSNIVQVGIRAQSKEEFELIKDRKIQTFYSHKIRSGFYGSNWQKKIVDKLNENIYLTFDVDYFDPSVIPATGTPEPDGFYYNETIEVFREIRRQEKKIIGFDVVELSPIPNLHHCDLTIARFIYKILNLIFY
ncbi:MAG: agmatinase [Candidatus Kapaibacteriales bacterium]